MGLGALPEFSLKETRQEAEKWRAVVRSGKDEIKERERQRREVKRNMHLLRDIAFDAFESRKAELNDDGKAGRWFSPLELHVLPKLGGMPVGQIAPVPLAYKGRHRSMTASRTGQQNDQAQVSSNEQVSF